MPKKTVEQIDPAGRRAFIRVDFNVPLNQDGTIADDRRIRAALPTIESVIRRGGRAILASHLGRPAGTGFEPALSLRPVAARLAELLHKDVQFPSNDCADRTTADAVNALTDGQVLLLENLRFHPGEKAGQADFARTLATYADLYVNDAFGTCHRADASMVALPRALAGRPRVAGLLLDRELRFLGDALANPDRPFVVVLGGAKVSDKLAAIEYLLPRADAVLVGGAMAYTFLKALGKRVGSSLVEAARLADARRILDRAAELKADLYLPLDHVCSTQKSQTAGDIEVFTDQIRDGFLGLDIGPETQSHFARIISSARTVVWNGPMGVFELAPFRVGTQQIARAIANATDRGATTIAGGGDTAAAIDRFDLAARFSHVSTGGGASLDMLAGKRFEAVDLLDDA